MIINNKKISNQYDRKRLLEFLYGNITGLMFYPQKAETDKTKKTILISAWCIFVRSLIDEGEKEILESEFFKDSRYYVAKNSYLSPILDMYNGEIISYNISGRPVLNQVLKMLDSAFEKIPNNTGLIFHSDQGWQYQHKKYQKKLLDKGIIQSMSRKGNCLDNSIMENFFGLLKSELFYLRKFESMDEFKLELEKYIDYYNNKRIKSKLKGLSPVQYRIQSSLVA